MQAWELYPKYSTSWKSKTIGAARGIRMQDLSFVSGLQLEGMHFDYLGQLSFLPKWRRALQFHSTCRLLDWKEAYCLDLLCLFRVHWILRKASNGCFSNQYCIVKVVASTMHNNLSCSNPIDKYSILSSLCYTAIPLHK